jgi:hypothetical protein
LVGRRGKDVEIVFLAKNRLVLDDRSDKTTEEVGEGIEPIQLLF